MYARWEDVEDETTSVDIKNVTEVKLFAENLITASTAYLNDIRRIEIWQLELLRTLSQNSKIDSLWSIYQRGAFINHVDSKWVGGVLNKKAKLVQMDLDMVKLLKNCSEIVQAKNDQ